MPRSGSNRTTCKRYTSLGAHLMCRRGDADLPHSVGGHRSGTSSRRQRRLSGPVRAHVSRREVPSENEEPETAAALHRRRRRTSELGSLTRLHKPTTSRSTSKRPTSEWTRRPTSCTSASTTLHSHSPRSRNRGRSWRRSELNTDDDDRDTRKRRPFGVRHRHGVLGPGHTGGAGGAHRQARPRTIEDLAAVRHDKQAARAAAASSSAASAASSSSSSSHSMRVFAPCSLRLLSASFAATNEKAERFWATCGSCSRATSSAKAQHFDFKRTPGSPKRTEPTTSASSRWRRRSSQP